MVVRGIIWATVLLALLGQNAWANKCPQVFVVFDRTGSMTSNIVHGDPTTKTKWEISVTAFKAFFEKWDQKIRFGFMFFNGSSEPTYGGDTLGGTDTDMCAIGVKRYDPDYGQGLKISADLDVLKPYGQTPTRQTLESLQNYLPLTDERFDSYILLFTDGIPNCPAGPATEQATVSVIDDLRTRSGIKTIVVGIGFGSSTSDTTVLNDMATAGGMAREPPALEKFYAISNPEDLENALATIVDVQLTIDTCRILTYEDGGPPDARQPRDTGSSSGKDTGGTGLNGDGGGGGGGCNCDIGRRGGSFFGASLVTAVLLAGGVRRRARKPQR